MKTLRKAVTLSIALLLPVISIACPFCNKETQEAIYDSRFLPNLVTMLSAFIVVTIIVVAITIFARRRYQRARTMNNSMQAADPAPLLSAALVLGIGLGGFVDGIVFHQILQWHEMLSNRIPPTTLVAKTVNMFWDGVFHAFCLIVTLVGLILMWSVLKKKEVNRSGSLLAGGLLIGWGVFNIVEGIIDHHLLKLHNVREISVDPEFWNVSFLIFSVVLIVIGVLLSRRTLTPVASSQIRADV
jgi:uncharacterized membrane protein